MSSSRSVRNHPMSRSTDASRWVRWRLWAAMFALALVPTAAGVYLTQSLLLPSGSSAAASHARDGPDLVALSRGA